jgi:hypothetical protein
MESHDNDIELRTMDVDDDENPPFPGTLWYHERIRLALVDWLTQFFPIVMMIPINNVQAWHQPMTSWWHNVDNQLFIQHFIDDLVTFAKHEQYRFVHRRRRRRCRRRRHYQEEEEEQQQQYDSVVVECHEDTKIKNNTAMRIQQILHDDPQGLIHRARDQHINNSSDDDSNSDDANNNSDDDDDNSIDDDSDYFLVQYP